MCSPELAAHSHSPNGCRMPCACNALGTVPRKQDICCVQPLPVRVLSQASASCLCACGVHVCLKGSARDPAWLYHALFKHGCFCCARTLVMHCSAQQRHQSGMRAHSRLVNGRL